MQKTPGEVTARIRDLKEQGLVPMVYIIPVDPDDLKNSGWSATGLGEAVQKVLESTTKGLLHIGPPMHGSSVSP